MNGELGPCIALGVPDLAAAEEFYGTRMRFRPGERRDNWLEMRSGPLRLYLVEDNSKMPCFELLVDDVPASRAELLAAGCELIRDDGNESFIRDPFGYEYCISVRS